jgi:hypothetical protein
MLESKILFTTLEYCEISNLPAELFCPCIQQLEDEWNDIFEAAEDHLINMVWELTTCLASFADHLLAEGDISFQRKKHRPYQDPFERCRTVDRLQKGAYDAKANP